MLAYHRAAKPRLVHAITALLALAAPIAAAQSASWQRLSLPTVAELQNRWVTPPPEYGPEPYYGLNGPATLETVQHDLDTMQSLGFRAVTVQWGSGSDRAYLSPEHLAFFKRFVAETKKRNMRIWIVDDAGYPSGFAGGRFSTEHPELRMQALVATGHAVVAPGVSFDQPTTPDTVAVTALHSTDGAIVAVPIANSRATWTAPAGDGAWTVYVVKHQFRTSPTRSDTNPKRTKDTAQSLEDYLDPAATAQYLRYTHEAYFKAVGDEFGKTVMGFRGDEPDYSINGLPWTPAFFDRFQREKGYDIRAWVAAFLQPKDVTLTQQQLRAKADYYDIFAKLFAEGFFKPQADWCAEHGVEYQVHLNHEEMQLQLVHSEGDFFRDMRFVQVPGVDSIWHQIWTDTISDFPRFASSAAHVYGHPRAFTESYAAYRPLPDIAMARYILNEQFVRGINLIETMYYPSTATPGHGGPMPFMRDPGYPALMQYAGRLSYVLSQGRPAAEVALLLPAESLWTGDSKADDTLVSTERLLSEHQIDFDIVDENAIGSLLKSEGGAFLSESGNRYRTVIVPRAPLLPKALIDRLRSFAQAGGHVVFLGAAPAFIGDRSNLDSRPATPADFSWAKIVNEELPATPTPPQFPPTSAPGPLDVPGPLLQAIEASVPLQAIKLETTDTALRFSTRTLKDGQLILLFNETDKPLHNRLLLRGKTRRVTRWDPQTGKTALLSTSRSLALELNPYETELLIVQ